MKIKNILMTLGLGSMLMTSCSLDEEVYTFISGEDLAADGEYELLVNGAYQPLAWLFEWGSRRISPHCRPCLISLTICRRHNHS